MVQFLAIKVDLLDQEAACLWMLPEQDEDRAPSTALANSQR